MGPPQRRGPAVGVRRRRLALRDRLHSVLLRTTVVQQLRELVAEVEGLLLAVAVRRVERLERRREVLGRARVLRGHLERLRLELAELLHDALAELVLGLAVEVEKLVLVARCLARFYFGHRGELAPGQTRHRLAERCGPRRQLELRLGLEPGVRVERGDDAAPVAVLGERRGRVPRYELRPVPLVRAQRQHAVQRQKVPQARARRRVGALDGPALRLAVELAPEGRVPGR
mmetsp:Transcript_21567/g.60816  ORF Transcript_21567/g.60816 Transcript_21567/m.60816 type:complete len:230 (-) Transcript_21567:51-740(-)